MRIVVSGTHASGKSTLVSDFAVRHPDFVVLPDLPLREVMNDVLLDLVADDEIVGAGRNVVEIAGSRTERLAALEALLIPAPRHP